MPAADLPLDLASCAPSTASDPWNPSTLAGFPDPGRPAITLPSRGVALLGEELARFDGESITFAPSTSSGGAGRQFGRPGGGPGEFAPQGARRAQPLRGSVEWLDASPDSLVVFDGTFLQWFDSVGIPLGRWNSVQKTLDGVFPFVGRIRLAPGMVVLGVEARREFSEAAGSRLRSFRLWGVREGDATVLARIDLPALPHTPRTGSYHGVAEATPVWDWYGQCFVISDGGSPHVILGRAGSRQLDTVPIPDALLSPVPGAVEDPRLLSQLGVQGRVPPPALQRTISDVRIDPAGWIWILPEQPVPGHSALLRVLRMRIGTREVLVDSVRAFPMVFHPGGGIVGARRDSASKDQGLINVAGRTSVR